MRSTGSRRGTGYPRGVAVPASRLAPAPSSADPNGYYPGGRVATLLSTSARLGLTRLYAPTEAGTLPPQSRDEARANLTTGSNLRSFVDEFAQASASAAE